MSLPLFSENTDKLIYRQGPVWCERNLILHPLVVLARTDFQELLKKHIGAQSLLAYEYIDPITGQRQIWKMKPDIELGYPGSFDKDVLITIQKLITDEGTSYKKPWFIKYYPGPRARSEIAHAKERLCRFEFLQRRLTAIQAPLALDSPETRFWVEELCQKLEGSTPGQSVYKTKNRPYYEALARLLVRGKLNSDKVREFLSEAFYQHHQGRIKKSRSAFFTDLLKRYLAEKGKNLKQLLREA